ncbi:MAG: putative multidrug resistance ABC transporter ATP-binding/permease protein YheI [Firmicutes bacterium]|nr:putative multidrug resistance ABC transporter ATP-binding/permease protein YheI [candidate division NPL-UPA2 bacterium]
MSALRVIWRLLWARPWLYAMNVVLWTAVYGLQLIPALLLRQTLDRVFAGEVSPVRHFAASMLAYVVVSVIVLTAGAVTDALHRFHTSSILRYNVMHRVLSRPGASAISTSPGEALDSLRDDAEHLEDTVGWIADFLGQLLYALAAIGIMLGINARVTVVVFLPLIAVGFLYNIASQGLEKYREATRQAASTVTGVLGEMFAAIQSVQMAQAEERSANRLRALNTERATFALRERKYNHGLEFLSNSTVGIGSAAILWVAGRELGGGNFTVGDFALFVTYLDYVTGIAEFYGYFVAYIQQGNVAVKRLLALSQRGAEDLTRPDRWLRPAESPPLVREELQVLSVRNLAYAYLGSGAGILDINFEIKRGELVVVTGRMGSGKTTLLRAVLGQLSSSAGEVLWNGKPLSGYQRGMVPPYAAYVRQSPLLLSGTLRENLNLGGTFSDNTIEVALRTAVFGVDFAALPHGLDTVVGVRGVKLSGGQVQRVAAARALIHHPELLVFDDLSSALDVKTEEELWQNLLGTERMGTYLVVSHRPQVLYRADKIIVLKEGRIDDQGTYGELMERCQEFRQLQGQE